MLKSKSKPQLKPLLSYGTITSTPVAIAVSITAIGTILSTFLQFINLGTNLNVNRHVKGMTVVQLSDGTAAAARFVEPLVRDDKTIKRFVSNTMISMFSWNGIVDTTENGESVTKPDKGIEIPTQNNNKKVIPTKTWETAFSFSEERDFRSNFLINLAELVPSGVFSGQIQVSLIPRHISSPVQIEEGVWEIVYIGTLVSFNRQKNQGEGIPFNKVITIRAIDSFPLPRKPSELDKTIYAARQSGLEITQIVDYSINPKK